MELWSRLEVKGRAEDGPVRTSRQGFEELSLRPFPLGAGRAPLPFPEPNKAHPCGFSPSLCSVLAGRGITQLWHLELPPGDLSSHCIIHGATSRNLKSAISEIFSSF